MNPLVLAALVAPLQGPSSKPVLHEDFDEPGTTWAATIFPVIIANPNVMPFTRESLAGVAGAPDTLPPLPINAGGDLEGRFSDPSISRSGWALGADAPQNTFGDVAVRGFVASAPLLGGPNIGFLVRTSIDPHPPFGSGFGLNAYTAILQTSSALATANLLLGRWRNGIVTAADVFATATFPVDLDQENYLLELRAQGELISARLWRAHVVAGSVAIDPIQLGVGPGGPTNLLWARDRELTSGRVGAFGFAPAPTSVFWDDVQVGVPSDRVRPLAQPPGPPVPINLIRTFQRKWALLALPPAVRVRS